MRNICLTVVVVTLVSSGYCHAGPDAAGGHAMLQTAPVVVGQAQPTTEPTLTGGALLQTAQLPTTPEGKVLIRSIRITGTTVFLPEELRLLVAGVEGQELSLAEIEALAARITSYYRSRGYVIARAYVPPQRVQDGILEIRDPLFRRAHQSLRRSPKGRARVQCAAARARNASPQRPSRSQGREHFEAGHRGRDDRRRSQRGQGSLDHRHRRNQQLWVASQRLLSGRLFGGSQQSDWAGGFRLRPVRRCSRAPG
ncbi:MAG: hypothetical protein E6H56_17065 [Betaproteobacteria bacterium]|nr:MAG: hypothetical protein E6H56_17065 [Betaproteobacteria bacterium]